MVDLGRQKGKVGKMVGGYFVCVNDREGGRDLSKLERKLGLQWRKPERETVKKKQF